MTLVSARPANRKDLVQVIPPGLRDHFTSRLGSKDSVTMAIEAEEKVIALAGIFGTVTQTGESWMWPTPDFYRYPMASIVMRNELRAAESVLGFPRYQVVVVKKEQKNIRFAQWMGYEEESVLHKYLNGEDCIMYARYDK